MKITAYFIYFLMLLVALTTSCKQDQPGSDDPEEVLKQYQAFIDKNQFEKARALSTPAGQEWLSELEAIISSEQPDSTVLDTRFLSISCQGTGDTIQCACVMEDQYEQYTAEYRIVRLRGQWLVDSPEEEITIENDIIESVPDSVLREYLEDGDAIIQE